MTNKGTLMSIDRFGINRDLDIGPLAKCSFEETTEQIFKAAIFGEKDEFRWCIFKYYDGSINSKWYR